MSKQVTIQKLLPGNAYHIYNRGNNRDKLFLDERNYFYFLKLWKKYIDPIADTYCYCLLPNHFHFYIRMKDSRDLYTAKGSIAKPAERFFSNLFNAYCKAINKGYRRRGSLFQERFRRKLIDSADYEKELVGYIVANAVKHGICRNVADYKFTSFHSLISDLPTCLKRKELLNIFGGKAGFIGYMEGYQKKIIARREFFEAEGED